MGFCPLAPCVLARRSWPSLASSSTFQLTSMEIKIRMGELPCRAGHDVAKARIRYIIPFCSTGGERPVMAGSPSASIR